jgi:ABC-type protease/lipase transport system fused ATPase/permease subunit
VVASWSLLMQARTSFDNLCRLFAETDSEEVARTRLPAPTGRLLVERVVTRMPGSATEALLKNVTFGLDPGELLGVIGPSGAGKTTLARVIAGANPPDLGAVRIDGANMADWDPDNLARYIGYLPQDSGLLAGTIKENISRFANWAGADPEEVDRLTIEAAQVAGIHDMILRLPMAYETKLGLNGGGLSAGQAQRVALARALYGSPALLVLDEPNSHLDAVGEQALIRCLSEMKARGCSVIVIAHRAGILNIADKLLVLRDGAVDQFGPVAEVTAYLSANENAGRIQGPQQKSSESKPHVVNRS